MSPPGWSFWCVLVTLPGALATSGHAGHEVICLQGLSDCTIEDMMLLSPRNDDVAVRNLKPYFKLCCRDGALCALCLVIDTEIDFKPASVTLCYSAASVMPTCKRVEFIGIYGSLTQKEWPKFRVVIREPAGVSFSTYVIVFSSEPAHLSREVEAPSLDEVCSQEQRERVQQCRVPRLSSVINQTMNWVELKLSDTNESLPSVCVQYEKNGKCLEWNRRPIPLYSVTPCMCLQVWNEGELGRSLSCPFVNTDVLQRNVWQNVSVSMRLGQVSNHHSMLWWNLSAPCRLEGEVWPCHNDHTCREMEGSRQQLANSTWGQNSKGLWEKKGVFEEIKSHLSPCVMVKLKGRRDVLGPFCEHTNRWRWSLLVVGLMLLVCLTVLAFYFLHDVVKEWVWSCRPGGFVKISKGGHVVLLSPPDVDDSVSESVCQLGAQLRHRGFNVLVDQCSRKEQCNLGPLPWLHSQLMEMNSRGGTFVLVLTRASLNRAEEWAHWSKEGSKTKREHGTVSPYSDVFTASLSIIQADKQLGRAAEHFLLVTLGSHPEGDRRLPELLRGLPMFQLPSQAKALLHELHVGRTVRGAGRRTWKGWEWITSGGGTAKTSQKASYSKGAQDDAEAR
ncbi:uncharacterized protein il17rc isoform 2-T2 [Spinachia spinachia]